ncbi:MAG: VanZ family protein [Blautia sp.]|nr:VanZ family protein [Blautia sp.]
MKKMIPLLKPFSFLPALAMMYIIYSFSAQPGADSGQLSFEISYDIVEIKDQILETGYSQDVLVQQAYGIHYYVRKAAHITEFFLLAVAVSFPLYVYGIRGIWLILLALFICAAYAGLDEYHQSFSYGRGATIVDVGIDCIGILLGVLLVQAFNWSVLHQPHRR